MTAIQIEVADAFTGFQLALRLREKAVVVRDGRGLMLTIDVDSNRLQKLLSEIRDGLASFDLETAKLQVDGHHYMLEVSGL